MLRTDELEGVIKKCVCLSTSEGGGHGKVKEAIDQRGLLAD